MRDHAFLAECDGEVIGFDSLITGGEPELDLMFMVDAAQGLGLGAQLFRHMQAEAERPVLALAVRPQPATDGGCSAPSTRVVHRGRHA